MNHAGEMPRGTRAYPSFFVGREAESLRLRRALLNRDSLLVSGPRGSGKTALISSTLRGLDDDLARRCFYLSGAKGLQDFLRRLVSQLREAEDPTLAAQLRAEAVRPENFKNWLRAQPSSRLKGALYRSAGSGKYRIFLDHVPPLTHAMAKVVKELVRMRETPVYLAARGDDERAVGHVADLYWNPVARLELRRLPEAAARDLLEHGIREYRLEKFDLDEFRAAVLHLSGRLPGAILDMCALAADLRYRYGNRIKTRLVHIDCRMAAAPVRRAGAAVIHRFR